MTVAYHLYLLVYFQKENEVDVKGLQDKLRHTENKMSEYRIQCSTLKNEIKMAQKVLYIITSQLYLFGVLFMSSNICYIISHGMIFHVCFLY